MGGRVDDLAVLDSNPGRLLCRHCHAAGCGRPPTAAPRGRSSSTTWMTPCRSVTSPSRPTTPISCGWARAKTTIARAARGATASTNLPTAGRPGSTWACAIRSTSLASSSIRSITTSSTSRRSAASGDPGKERGVFKSTDGGLTWTNVLFVNDDTGATELVQDPSNNKVLYAATYQRRRATWGFNGGGPGSGIHKSSDGGRTWTKLTGGIPSGPLGRIGMDIYRSQPEHSLRAHRASDRERHLSIR